MFGSLLILLVLPLTDLGRVRGSQFRPLMRFNVISFIFVFIILMWIGGSHAETPFIEIGQVATALYFSWFLIFVPLTGIIENTLMDIATNKDLKSGN
jgi:ubiquinol-cytochrome c reductase cytochrome b subunit